MENFIRKPVMLIKHPQEQILSTNPCISMSLAAASARNRQHLQSLIQQHLRRIINFDEVSIRLVNEDHHTQVPYLHYSQINKKHSGNKDMAHPVQDGFFDVTLCSDSPVIWDLEDVSRWPEQSSYAAYLMANQIKSVVSVAIISVDKQIGAIFFGFTESCDFSNHDLDLFQETTSYIAIALTNIFDVEAITAEVREKEQLLTLGDAIASVRDKVSFDQVINQHLKKVIGFNDLVVLNIDRARGTQRPYIIHLEKRQDGKSKEADQRSPETSFLGDGVMGHLLLATGPLIWSKSDMDKCREFPPYLKLNSKLKVEKIVGFPLVNHKSVVGVIFLFSGDEHAFSSSELVRINLVCRQLSVAILNIAANEEIQRHNEEKEMLLSFSKTLATVKSRKQFSMALKNGLNKLNFYEDAALFYLKTGSKSHLPVVIKQTTSEFFQPDWYANDSMNFTTYDPLIAFLEQHKKARAFDFSYGNELNDFPDYVAYWRKKGCEKFIAVPVFLGQEMIAVLFFLTSVQLPSFLSHLDFVDQIACQLSIVAAGINANEKAISYFEEISKVNQQKQFQDLSIDEISTSYNFSEIVGSSDVMRNVFYLVSQVANTNSTVLILGETGTGKELVARAIHKASSRKGKDMIKINCATLPANLIESELFGHEKGAFTGATERRIGKFEIAHNSTLFLDEVGELPFELQGKLLRVLQEKEIERIGGKAIIKTDVRIIAATNRDLGKEVRAGTFRSDLYFRLNVFPIVVPPLRHRKEDIAPLTSHFLIKYAKGGHTEIKHLSGNAMKRIIAYNWPGNVRELEHLIERSVLLAKGRLIEQVYLPDFEEEEKPLLNHDIKTIDEVEKEHILSILKMTKGKVSGIGGAAEILRIPATTLTSKIRRLKIRKGI